MDTEVGAWLVVVGVEGAVQDLGEVAVMAGCTAGRWCYCGEKVEDWVVKKVMVEAGRSRVGGSVLQTETVSARQGAYLNSNDAFAANHVSSPATLSQFAVHLLPQLLFIPRHTREVSEKREMVKRGKEDLVR